MGRYQRKTDRQSWSTESMAGAIQEVLEGKMGYRRASKAYNVPQTTLERKVKEARQKELSTQAAAAKRLGRYKTVFSEAQEKELVDHLLHLEERLFGVTLSDLRTLAFELAEKHKIQHVFNMEQRMAGKDWLSGFLKRHPILTVKKGEPSKDPSNPDYVPTIFKREEIDEKSQRQALERSKRNKKRRKTTVSSQSASASAEMVSHCCVKGCKTSSVNGSGVTFHSFPENEVYRKMWLAQVNRENFTVKDSTKVCSKHFKDECFERLKCGETRLKKDAVPSIFNLCNCPKKQTLIKDSIPQVNLDTVSCSSNVLNLQNQVPSISNPNVKNQVRVESISPIPNVLNQVEVETILPSLNIPSFQNLERVDTIPSSPNVLSFQNQVKVETILPSSNFSNFQNRAVKVEEVSLSENEISPFQEQTIATPVSQIQGDTDNTKEKRKYYLGDYDENDMHSPSKAKRVLALAKARDVVYRKEIQFLRRKNAMMARKITTLKKIVKELTSKKLKGDQKTSNRSRDRTLRCMDDVEEMMVEEIGMIVNDLSPTTSDCEADSFSFLPDETLQRSTASHGSSSVPAMSKRKGPEEEIQGGQSQWQPVGLNEGPKLYIKNTIKTGENNTDSES